MLRKSPPILLVAITLLATLLVPARAHEAISLSGALPALKPRCIGPANMSGRMVDVAVYEREPRIMYVAAASGGLWKTTNNGTTWKAVFEHENTAALGAVAVHQENPDVVWVGTGEGNPRNSVSWGDGVYRSTNGGTTWQHVGLKETHHIGRIVLHPRNPAIAYVAAVGHLWGPNLQRGLFKTTDGGSTWSHVLALGDSTGCVDVAIDPEDPDVLYAAAYHVRRDAFSGGNPAVQTGPGAGLYKTSDGGRNWTQMKGGLPERPYGRCGLAIYRKNPNVVYAVAQTDKTSVTTAGQAANDKDLGPDSGGIFRSDDKGKTWTYLNSLCPRPFYYGQIRIDPGNDKRIYVLGVPFFVSNDGGRSFLDGNQARGTHGDYHALWIDPRASHHLVLGCDGGLNFSFDKGETWEHLKNLPVGQFYAVGPDMRKPYRVYGGLQDNGTWGGPSATHDNAGITIAEWINILGFDGYHCQVDPDDPDTVYCEGQYAILRRVNVRTGAATDIKPHTSDKQSTSNIVPDPGKMPDFRFNWSSPILLSPHNGKTVYFGGNYLFRSTDRGDTWAIVSPDLTGGHPGPSKYSGHTITTIAESPRKPGLLYVGTDDGKIWRSEDAGKTWHDLSETIAGMAPQGWITRVECSHFDEATVYLSIDRHRNDDTAAYLFKSTDHGKTWTSVAGALPPQCPVHVVREDPVNKDLLYAGTECGLYVSLDGGYSWTRQGLLPTVPVHDLVIHPRDRELVIATHGRAVWIMDVRPLQELGPKILAEPAHLFSIGTATAYRPRTLHALGIKAFSGENPPYGAGIYLYLREMPKVAPQVTILDKDGKKVAEFQAEKTLGLQRVNWRFGAGGGPELKGGFKRGSMGAGGMGAGGMGAGGMGAGGMGGGGKGGGPKGGGPGFFRPISPGTYTVSVQVDKLVLQRPFQVEAEE
jgi:photosystem II stability/assembly factor-like uncharacterized protein